MKICVRDYFILPDYFFCWNLVLSLIKKKFVSYSIIENFSFRYFYQYIPYKKMKYYLIEMKRKYTVTVNDLFGWFILEIFIITGYI